MTIYLHDGGSTGHATWCEQALTSGAADGVFISPFFTPAIRRSGQPSGADLADRTRNVGGQVVLDATTHAVSLPGVDKWTAYDTWSLWDGPRGDLSTAALQRGHLARVSAVQDLVGSVHFAPTLALDSPVGGDADTALELATEATSLDSASWQSLAGRRGFWLSPDLDNYVGSLAALRAPVWVVTVVRERGDYPPDMSEIAQTAAICRTVHSLSKRSRVIVAQSDLYGLPAIAAGADSIGSGWYTKQRVCAPSTYQRNDDQIRRAALWMTYQGLLGRLHQTDSETLVRLDRPGGHGPVSGQSDSQQSGLTRSSPCRARQRRGSSAHRR